MRYICTAVVATLILAGTSFAATINVPGDYATIQGAINASSNGDVIAIAAGTYHEHSLNPGGKAITIQGTLNSDGSLATTIDAQQSGGVFRINHGEGSGTEIKDLVITGGTGTEDTYGYTHGGGIYCYNSSPTISNCMISGNTYVDTIALFGGGIKCSNSNPTISECTIKDNTANFGAGIYCYNSSPTISNCTITDNTGIASSSKGAGIYCDGSNPTISDCTISGNTTGWSGGGIYCEDNSNPAISDSTISGNTAGFNGGGIFSDNSNPTITGSFICENEIYGPYTADSATCIPEWSCDLCTVDSDEDGVPDYMDQCPGYDDNADADNDGTPDDCDNCPDDPLKAEPGDCGCGELETDTDSDGTPDCIDGCPDDPLKTEPGVCGCDVAETTVIGDLNCDGVYDIDDIYAGMAEFGIDEAGQCAGDTDGNGVVDIEDLLNMMGSWGACP